jgi:hypothetical protein
VIARRYFENGRLDARTTKAIRIASRLGDNSRGYAILPAGRSVYVAGKSIRDEFEYSFVKRFVPR